MFRSTLSTLALASALAAAALGHGFVSQPRTRGGLYTQRPVGNLANEQDVTWAYCPHCQNGGGVDALRGKAGNVVDGRWVAYKPLDGAFRNGVSVCGDPDGNNDHAADGRYGAPDAIPTVAEYAAGGIANFEYDLTTPHNGYLQFYLCDVSASGDLERGSFTSGKCYLLERAMNADCESGEDSECGPVDPAHPSRWYLPCRVSDARDQDQIVGGDNGKMSYKIPDVAMDKAVIQAYWLTGNSCTPDGLEEYFTSGAWKAVENSKCAGDGGTVGGYRADHTGTCTTQAGKFPEEFWNCADVKIVGGGTAGVNSGIAPGSGTPQNAVQETTTDSPTTDSPTTDSPTTEEPTTEEPNTEEPNTEEPNTEEPRAVSSTSAPTQTDAEEPAATTAQAEQERGSANRGRSGSYYYYYYHNKAPASTSSSSDNLRPGCMPKIDSTRTDTGYLNYVEQLKKYCAA